MSSQFVSNPGDFSVFGLPQANPCMNPVMVVSQQAGPLSLSTAAGTNLAFDTIPLNQTQASYTGGVFTLPSGVYKLTTHLTWNTSNNATVVLPSVAASTSALALAPAEIKIQTAASSGSLNLIGYISTTTGCTATASLAWTGGATFNLNPTGACYMVLEQSTLPGNNAPFGQLYGLPPVVL